MAAPVTAVALTAEDLRAPRFTPRDLRLIAQQFGRTFSAIVADELSDDKFVVLAWLKLRRDGHDIDLDGMDDVTISLDIVAPDPTNGQRATISPSSAATGA